jgi:DNA gyrase subunit A
MGVQFAKPGKSDTIVAVARNPEREVEEAVEAIEAAAEAGTGVGTGGGAGGGLGTADPLATALASGDGDDAISTGERGESRHADEATDAVPSVDDEDSGGRE